MSKHTPGPWRIGDAGKTIFGPPNGNPAPEVVAHTNRKNAALIAAAPELLEALIQLRACHRAFSSNDNWTGLDDSARELALLAINKAEGK